MQVLKIIQANPEIFNVDRNNNYSEIEAIRAIASMECKGNKIQKEIFSIRQTYIAICNLIDIGYIRTATDLAIKLIPKAELSQQYKIAQDLCEIILTHFFQDGNLDSIPIYKSLYDKFTVLLAYEHASKLLYGKAIHNAKYILPIGASEVTQLLDAIKKKLPNDCLWYHYYYYQCKSLIYKGKNLEKLYLEAIKYFENLYANHSLFVSIFSDELIQFYRENNDLEKAEILLEKQKENGTVFL